MSVVIFKSNTVPPLIYEFKRIVDSSVTPYPIPQSASVVFNMVDSSGASVVQDGPAVVVNPAAQTPSDVDAGKVRYDWSEGDVDQAGPFVGWFSVRYSNGTRQDTPSFTIEIIEHVYSGLNKYINAASLKAFTMNQRIKDLPDSFLATNIIPRAEAIVSMLGPFKEGLVCQTNVRLAVSLVAERLADLASAKLTAGGGEQSIKSETIGDYSYTLYPKDGSGQVSKGEYDSVIDEVRGLLAGCMVVTDVDPYGVIGHSSGTRVFPDLPGYDDDGGFFDVETEIMYPTFRGVWRRRV